jgi:hypothetical protein
MTTTVPEGSPAAPVGPPPPFDPELAAALAVLNEQLASRDTGNDPSPAAAEPRGSPSAG